MVDLTIHADAADGDRPARLVIALADNGVGLPPERERLTEPYMTTRVRGTGLGLAIVKKIVEEHFGTIGFSDRPGGGAIVEIVLDAATLAPLAGVGEADQDGDGGLEPPVPELTRTKVG
jgi:two-component system nitrogen regulation sensor histidine kinase NtrY